MLIHNSHGPGGVGQAGPGNVHLGALGRGVERVAVGKGLVGFRVGVGLHRILVAAASGQQAEQEQAEKCPQRHCCLLMSLLEGVWRKVMVVFANVNKNN